MGDAVDLVANGLSPTKRPWQENPELVRGMVTAMLKGMQYTTDHPDKAFEISKKYVENLAEADQEVQMQVLLEFHRAVAGGAYGLL